MAFTEDAPEAGDRERRSVRGIIGSVLSIIATLLLMLSFIEMATPTYFVMNAPTALFELSLAVLLIARGSNPLVADRVEDMLPNKRFDPTAAPVKYSEVQVSISVPCGPSAPRSR
jgi:hypothetical protein